MSTISNQTINVTDSVFMENPYLPWYFPPFYNDSGQFIIYCNACDAGKSPSQTYRNYNFAMILVTLPLVGLFGVVGNSLSATVYSRPVMRSSLNTYLCGLACSDIFVIFTAVFLFTVEGMRRFHYKIAIFYADLSKWMFPLALNAQTCSVYFTVAAGIDAFISVVLSRHTAARCCKISRAIKVLLLIVFLSLMYNTPHCFEIDIYPCFDQVAKQVSKQVCPSTFRMDPDFNLLYYTYGYTIFLAAGPLALLIVLNTTIIIKLTLTKRKQKQLAHSHTTITPSEENEPEGDDPITLILVVCLFIGCNSMALVINFLEFFMGDALGNTLNYLVDVSNFLVVCNSSANFIIYYIFGGNFKDVLAGLFCTNRVKYQPGEPVVAGRLCTGVKDGKEAEGDLTQLVAMDPCFANNGSTDAKIRQEQYTSPVLEWRMAV